MQRFRRVPGLEKYERLATVEKLKESPIHSAFLNPPYFLAPPCHL